MLKIVSQFEQVLNGKVFRLVCDPDSALQDAKEFAIQFLAFLAKIEEENKAKQAQAQAEAAAQPAPASQPDIKPAE